MNHSESIQIFERFLYQRYEEFKGQLENMLRTMSSNDRGAKLSASRQFLTTSSGLALTLAVSDRPEWLTDLVNVTEWYIANNDDDNANHMHLMNIMGLYEQAMNHEWFLLQPDNDIEYGFDDNYERYRVESSVIVLFDELVETLDQMIDSCEIDSVSAISSLTQLISLINQNKNGSYFSVLASHDFIGRFMKNATWMQIRKIPGVKNFKDAFEKTAKELDSELDRLHKEIVDDVQLTFDSSIKPMGHKNINKKIMLEVVHEA